MIDIFKVLTTSLFVDDSNRKTYKLSLLIILRWPLFFLYEKFKHHTKANVLVMQDEKSPVNSRCIFRGVTVQRRTVDEGQYKMFARKRRANVHVWVGCGQRDSVQQVIACGSLIFSNSLQKDGELYGGISILYSSG